MSKREAYEGSSALPLIIEKDGEVLFLSPSLNHPFPLQGELNYNFLLKDQEGKSYLLRIPRENPSKESIKEEYQGIGFLAVGGEYRFRSIQEQATFYQQCRKEGVLVPEVIYWNNRFFIRRFIPGEIYCHYLKRGGKPEIIGKYLETIANAHLKGIVLGDRWGPNCVVTEDDKLFHFDFDIALLGRGAGEFELSQAIYYSILNARNKDGALEEALNFLRKREVYKGGDELLLRKFLEGHLVFFENTRYGGIERQIEFLITRTF